MRILIIIILMLSSFYGNLIAQEIDSTAINFFKILNDQTNQGIFIGCGVFPDGYFAIGSSGTNQGVKYLSLKTYDFEGNLLSDFSLDNEENGYKQVNYGKCMAQISETDWVVAYSRADNNNNSHIRIIRFNLEGEVLWQTDLESNYYEIGRQLIITQEGNIGIVGESYIVSVTKKGYTAMINGETGEEIWVYLDDTIGNSINSASTSIVEFSTSIIVTGRKEVDEVYYPYIHKLSKINGELIEEKVILEDVGCNCNLYKIEDTENEYYYGSCHWENEILHRGIVDTSFNFLWEKFVSFDEYYETAPILPIISKDRSMVGIREYDIDTPQGERSQIEMFGLDSEGELSFVTKIPTDPTKEVYVRDLRKTPDGGYLIAGYEHFPSPQRGWLIKTDSLGNCCQLPNCDSIGYVIDTVFTSNFDITTARSGLQVFPNPIQKNGLVNIVLNDSYDAIESSQIFSIDGKQLFFSANDNTNQVPTSSLISGIYMLKIRTRKGVVYTRRLVVE